MQTLTINGKDLMLQPTTGKVLSTNKNMETKVSGHGGGGGTFRGTGFNSSVKITSKTTVHDQIFIEDKDGKEHSYELQDFNVSCREGNLLTVIATFKEASQSGHNIAVINHTTNKTFFDEKALQKVALPNPLLYIGIFILTIFILVKMESDITGAAGFFLFIGLFGYCFFKMKTNISQIKKSINPELYID